MLVKNGVEYLLSNHWHILLSVGGSASLRMIDRPAEVKKATVFAIELVRIGNNTVCPPHWVAKSQCLLKGQSTNLKLMCNFLPEPASDEVQLSFPTGGTSH